jgi:hypothetical protein
MQESEEVKRRKVSKVQFLYPLALRDVGDTKHTIPDIYKSADKADIYI